MDLSGGKTIYGGYDDTATKDGATNDTVIVKGTVTGDATIIGVYSAGGTADGTVDGKEITVIGIGDKVTRSNTVEIAENADVTATEIIGGKTDSGTVDKVTVKLNENVTVTGDVTVAKASGTGGEVTTANAIELNDNVKIDGNLTLVETKDTAVSGQSLTIDKAVEITGTVTTALSESGAVSDNTLTISDEDASIGYAYGAFSAQGDATGNKAALGSVDDGANISTVTINGDVYGGYSGGGSGTIGSASTTGNVVDFYSGEVSGAVVGGNQTTVADRQTDANVLNVYYQSKETSQRKAGNVDGFGTITFKGSLSDIKVSNDAEKDKAALILIGTGDTDLANVQIDINDGIYNPGGKNPANPSEDELDADAKYYLIHAAGKLTNYTQAKDSVTGEGIIIGDRTGNGETAGGDTTIGAAQINQKYTIKSSTVYTRDIAGMYVSGDEHDLYITGACTIDEDWDNDTFDTDEMTKYGKPSNEGNIITVAADAGDLAGKTIYGGYSGRDTVQNNSITINGGSNATVIGGYSESGVVESTNDITLKEGITFDGEIIGAQTKDGQIKGVSISLENDTNATMLTVADITGTGTVSTDEIKLSDAADSTVKLGSNVTIGDLTGTRTQSKAIDGKTLEIGKTDLNITGTAAAAQSESAAT